MTTIEDRLRVDLRDLADTLTDRATTVPPTSARPVRAESCRSRRPAARWFGAAAAALLAVAATVGLLSRDRGGDPATTATLPAEPGGPLFVLPTEASGLALTNGNVSIAELTSDDLPIDQMIVGIVDGDVITSPARVTVTDEQGPVDVDWTTVDTESGAASVVESDLWTIVTQQRGGYWLQVQTTGDAADAQFVLAAVVVDISGRVDLDRSTTLTIVERPAAVPGPATGVYTDVDDPTDDHSIVVETASSVTPLAIISRIGESAEPIVVDNTLGWSTTHEDPDGAWYGVVWQVTPDHIVAVSGHTDLDEVLAVANSLEVVDEATWRAALPTAVFTTE